MGKIIRAERWVVLIWAAAILSPACSRLPSPVVAPPEIKSIQGFGSLKMSGEQGRSRSKFSFLFQMPGQGRIEVFDALGRSLFLIIFSEENAVFVLPSKKAYCRGSEQEMLERFLGFSLSRQELTELLGGRFGFPASWELEEAENGRVVSGRRDGLQFDIREFFPGGSVPRKMDFRHPQSSGQFKLLLISFNSPVDGRAFSLAFLNGYQEKDWPEMERLLSHED